MHTYRSDQTFSVLIFLGNIYYGKLCVFKVFEYMCPQTMTRSRLSLSKEATWLAIKGKPNGKREAC